MDELSVKFKVTKSIYKSWDSYNRYQKWIGKQLIKAIKERYEQREQIPTIHSD